MIIGFLESCMPEGMREVNMSLSLFVNFNGNCREAVTFYAGVFGLPVPNFMAFGDGPPDPNFSIPDGAKDLVMYTSLKIAGGDVMFSDTWPEMPVVVGSNVSLTLGSTDEAEIRSWFEKLEEGGSVDMPLQETFWSRCYGSLTDKFGVMWQVSHDDGRPMP